MSLNTIYVTVGTTRFDELVTEVVSAPVLTTLQQRRCKKLIVQYGHGTPVRNTDIIKKFGITIDQYDFKLETPRTDILNADLVIGHAGAGTCMDILNHRRPGIIVFNDRLMDNHQKELAEQLSEEGYIFCSSVKRLAQTIDKADITKLKPYGSRNNMHSFVQYLNEMMSA